MQTKFSFHSLRCTANHVPSIHQFRHSIEHATSQLHASNGMIMTTTTAKSTSSQAQPSLRRRMHRHMLDRAPSLSSLNSLASAELKILLEITHRARRGKAGRARRDRKKKLCALKRSMRVGRRAMRRMRMRRLLKRLLLPSLVRLGQRREGENEPEPR